MINTIRKQQIRHEINELIHNIRDHNAPSYSLPPLNNPYQQSRKPFALIASAMLLGALLVLAFLPLANAMKLFNSHKLPVHILSPDPVVMRVNIEPRTEK
jgi:hypothetical protein